MQTEEDVGTSPVLAPKQKDVPKEEPVDNSPSKTVPAASARGTPSQSKSSSKVKRKPGVDDVKTANGAPTKKLKTDNVCHFLSHSLTSIFLCTYAISYFTV